jgi:hypothetical protein
MSNLAITDDILVDDSDSLPAARVYVQESGVYPVKIDLAYFDKSVGGALAVKVHYKESPFEGFTHKETYWVTTGDKKENRNYYIDSEGNKRLLKGMIQAEHLCQLTVGKHLDDLRKSAENKVIKLWSYEARKEIPTEVRVLTELIGKELQIGLIKKIENKRVLGEDGNWGPGPDKRELNEVDKHFNAEGQTVAEMKSKESPTFINSWKAKYEGVTKDEYDPSIKAGSSESAPAPAPASDTKPLFS